MGQLERYGLYVLVVVIFLILGVAIWGEDPQSPRTNSPVEESGALNIPDNQPTPSERLNPFIGAPTAFVDGPLPGQDDRGMSVIGDDVAIETNLDRLPVDRTPIIASLEPAPAPAAAKTYVVQRGDSFAKISRKLFGTERHDKDIMALNGISNPLALRPGDTLKLPEVEAATGTSTPTSVPTTGPTPAVASGGRTYTVVAGDSFARIAQKLFGHERYATEIMKLNGIADPRALQPDQVLRLPEVGSASSQQVVAVEASAGRTYTVEPGDSFARISRKLFGTESHAAEIMRLNGIDDPRRLMAGAVIRVPAAVRDGE